jgi:hypothetical protein
LPAEQLFAGSEGVRALAGVFGPFSKKGRSWGARPGRLAPYANAIDVCPPRRGVPNSRVGRGIEMRPLDFGRRPVNRPRSDCCGPFKFGRHGLEEGGPSVPFERRS